jgi:ornithine cyclodeaminase/alanine dehydrogenase-like protein (mu-crystallin family)
MPQSSTPRRSAAEIGKGALEFCCIGEQEVVRLLDPAALLDALEAGFRALALGRVAAPPRPEIVVPGAGFSLAMTAWMEGMNITAKIVNVFEGNLARHLPNHLALINLFDPATGLPLCVMDGTAITGLRTAAAAVLSVRLLARSDARVAAIVGAGVQAREHLRLLSLVRGLAEIRIASLHREDAEGLAATSPIARAVDDVEAAVAGADVVCLCTHSCEPVIEPAWIAAGAHVTSVGYAPPRGELPPELARRHALFVEAPEAWEPPPIGCAELAGLAPGRRSATQITVYKGMGIAMEDMVAAHLVWERARIEGAGTMCML